MEAVTNPSLHIFSLNKDSIDCIVPYLGLSHMIFLKRTCKIFYSIVSNHNFYQAYRLATVDAVPDMPRELDDDLKDALIYGERYYPEETLRNGEKIYPDDITLVKDKMILLCKHTNDSIWLRYYLDRQCTQDILERKWFTMPHCYGIDTIRPLIEQKKDQWGSIYPGKDYSLLSEEDRGLVEKYLENFFSVVVQHGHIGAIAAGKMDLRDFFLSHGANVENGLYAAFCVGNVELVKQMLPPILEELSDSEVERLQEKLFRQALKSNRIDLVKIAVAHQDFEPNQVLSHTRDITEGDNILFDCGCISTEIVEYLLEMEVIDGDYAIEWALLAGDEKYLSNPPIRIDWNKHADNISYYDTIPEKYEAYLYCLMQGAEEDRLEIFFERPKVFEKGLRYLVDSKRKTWNDLFMLACINYNTESILYCFEKIPLPDVKSKQVLLLDAWNHMIMSVHKVYGMISAEQEDRAKETVSNLFRECTGCTPIHFLMDPLMYDRNQSTEEETNQKKRKNDSDRDE